VTDLTGPGVRVLLIGTATHSGPSLPSLPSVSRSVLRLSAALRERCGVADRNLAVVVDPPDARTMAERVAEQARQAESVLLIYYLGHGLLGLSDELYLAASGTDTLTPGLAAHQALPFSAITEALSSCRAGSVIVVLDCCFSGRAAYAERRTGQRRGFTLPPAHGMYLLASADQFALAPEDEECTAFTGAVVDLLVQGDPLQRRLLTLDDVYDHLFRVFRARGGPLPRRQAGDRSGDLIIVANSAHPEPAQPEPTRPEETASEGRCPYQGLSAYDVDDARMFRGRDSVTADLVAAAARAMAASLPLIVVGSSGAGKSSLLQAGLLARLSEGTAELPGSSAWPRLTLTPGESPMRTLAARLGPLRDRQPTGDERTGDERTGDGRFVVVVDQLEQLFVHGASVAEQEKFIQELCALAAPSAEGTGGALIVLALRADFYGHASSHPQLRTALRESQFLVGPMTQTELRAAIEEPARLAGLQLDDGLADVILHELGGTGSEMLPLLSHALWAIWQRRRGPHLTMAGYRATGGIAQAIATSADAAYGQLDPGQQAAARRMLPRMVRVDEEAADTVRPHDLDDLVDCSPDPMAARGALNKLADARLVTVSRDSARISHEALLKTWPLLRGWIEADRDWLRIYQRLRDDARAWRQAGNDRSRLYRGATLAAVLERADEAADASRLPPDASEFLIASRRQQRRAGRLRTMVIAVLSVLLVVSVAAGGTAVAFQRQTLAQRNMVLAQLLVAEANEVRPDDPNLATQLGLLAYRLDAQAGATALLASQGSPGAYDDGEAVLDLAEEASGRVLAISTGNALRLWSNKGYPIAQISGLSTGPVVVGSSRQFIAAGTGPANAAYLAPGQATSLPATSDQLRLWSVVNPARPRALATVPTSGGAVTALALSPSEQVLAAAFSDGAIKLWDLASVRHPRLAAVLPGDGKEVDSLAFAPKGSTLASYGADEQIRLWQLTSLSHVRQAAHILTNAKPPGNSSPAVRHELAFSPDGRLLAGPYSSDNDNYPAVWNVTDPSAPTQVATPAGMSRTDCGGLVGLAFAPTGQALVSSCVEGMQVWNLYAANSTSPVSLQLATSIPDGMPGAGGAVIVQPGTSDVLVVSPVGVRTWNLTDDAEPGALSSFFASAGIVPGSIAVNATGRPLLADTASAAAIRLWNLSQPANAQLLAQFPSIPPPGIQLRVDAQAGGIALSGGGQVLAASQLENGRPVVTLRRTARPYVPVATIGGFTNGAIGLALSRDGQLLAVADNSNYTPDQVAPPTVKLFNLHDLARPRLVATLSGAAFDVVFSPDSRMLTAYAANVMLSWDISDPGRPVPLPPRHMSPSSVDTTGAFSPGGTLLAVGDSVGMVQIWRVRDNRLTGQPTVLKPSGDASVAGLAFSPDGRILAMPGLLNADPDQPAIELWDVSDPQAPRLEAQWANPNGDSVYSLAFSSDDKTLAAVGEYAVNLWDIDPARVAASACDDVGDVMTRQQWLEYVPNLPYRPPCE
jgi:WD40 repeat protein